MKKLALALLSLMAMFQVALVAVPVHAGPLDQSSAQLGTFGGAAGYSPDTGGTSLVATIAKIIKALLGFMGIVFVVLIIYAGFLWMTAAGSDEKIKKAKQIIQSCVIGLVIMVMAYSITTFVFNQLMTATS